MKRKRRPTHTGVSRANSHNAFIEKPLSVNHEAEPVMYKTLFTEATRHIWRNRLRKSHVGS